ncbi:MAG: VOC family protein [Candidatus Gracilibacteria bacterium]|jgi:glyoxylase I family protein|nr:VOC family protein [Candidatus Gracilibacteria bacterium]
MILKNVNHIAIIVSDFEISKEFYINKLGFKAIHQIDRPERQSSILYLDAGNAIIELFSFPSPPKRTSYPEACGLRHLAFNVENFDETIIKLNEIGIETEPVRTDDRTGKKMTFFKDPDDLPLEICEM